MFKNKVLMITGGTGSFGNAVLKRFLSTDVREIRIFSRDEKKQEEMRVALNNDKLKFYIGDVRDYDAVHQAMKGVHLVFHAAALKQNVTDARCGYMQSLRQCVRTQVERLQVVLTKDFTRVNRPHSIFKHKLPFQGATQDRHWPAQWGSSIKTSHGPFVPI